MQTATLKVSESFESPQDLQTVWELITDPVKVVHCMPGASLGEIREDGSIEGMLEASLGPVKVRFSGTVLPEYDHTEHSGSLVAKGSDAGGRTMASATTDFRLQRVDDGRTAVLLDATFNVSGGLAPFAQTGGVHLVRTMLADFAANLAELAEQNRRPASEERAASGTGTAAAAAGGRAAGDGPIGGRPQAHHRIRGFRLGLRVLWSMTRSLFARVFGRGGRRKTGSDNGIGEHDEGQ